MAGVRTSRLPRSRPGANPIELTCLAALIGYFKNTGEFFRGRWRFIFFVIKLSYMYSKLFVSLNRWSFSWVSLFMLSDLNARNNFGRTRVRVSLFVIFFP